MSSSPTGILCSARAGTRQGSAAATVVAYTSKYRFTACWPFSTDTGTDTGSVCVMHVREKHCAVNWQRYLTNAVPWPGWPCVAMHLCRHNTKTGKCAACEQPTQGIFNIATDILKKIKQGKGS